MTTWGSKYRSLTNDSDPWGSHCHGTGAVGPLASLGSLILSNPAKHLFLSWCQCHHQNTGNVLVNPHALLLYFPWCTWHFLSPLREGQKVSNSQQEESLGSSSGLAGPTLLMGPPRNHTPGCQLPPAACLLRPGLGQGRREGAHQWKQEVTCLMAAIALCLGFQIRKQCQRFPPPISNSTSRNTTSSGWTAVARKMGDSDPAQTSFFLPPRPAMGLNLWLQELFAPMAPLSAPFHSCSPAFISDVLVCV